MGAAFYATLGAYAFCGALHLGAVSLENYPLRCVTKALLLPLLAGAYLAGAAVIRPPVLAALALGWAGDLFLLKNENKLCFRLGLLFFLLGHISYAAAFALIAPSFSLPLFAVSGAVFAGLGFPAFRLIRPENDMAAPVIAYMCVIAVMSLMALQTLAARPGPPSGAVFAGSLAFMASDTIIARFACRKRPRYATPLIMITYIIAQALIVCGSSSLM